jgi:hypothetical protein
MTLRSRVCARPCASRICRTRSTSSPAWLARAGWGTVYVVEDTELRRRVALKVLDVADAGIEARLRREAQVLARLEHPGIAPVHAP